jgi:quercetin dioxygenase-like cupin family protein
MQKATKTFVALAASAGALIGAASGVALATPASGVLSAPVLARGAFTEPVDIKFKISGAHGREVINVKSAADTVVQQIVLAADGQTGWHTHHGPVVVVVKSGTVTFFDEHKGSCTTKTYGPGQSFVDPGQGNAHLVRNTGGGTAELWATYFDVPKGEGPRIDAPDPGVCS